MSGDGGPAGLEIARALRSGTSEDWEALRAAVDSLAKETTFANWEKGVLTSSGGQVQQLPHPNYTEPVRESMERFAALGLMIPFDWVHWVELTRFRDRPEELELAPVADSVRILVAVQRSERFTDGSLEGALESGLVQTALARILRWHDDTGRNGD